MTVICEFCSGEFKNNNILNKHKTGAKYCIKIQQDKSEDFKIKIFKCEWCQKECFRQDNFKMHIKNCKNNPEHNTKNKSYILLQEKDKIIRERDMYIIELEKKIIMLETRLEDREEISNEFKTLHSKREECIEKIALQPKTTTKNTSNSTQNNILNNLPIFNLTKEKLQLIASTEFTHELFLRGQEGAAKFATNIARKENDGELPWVVSDKNRGIVKMKGEGGIIITDYDVEIITNLVFEAIKDKNQEYFDAAYPPYDTDAEELDPDEAERVEANKARADKCFSDIAKMRRNNKVFKKKLIEYSL